MEVRILSAAFRKTPKFGNLEMAFAESARWGAGVDLPVRRPGAGGGLISVRLWGVRGSGNLVLPLQFVSGIGASVG